MKTADAFANTAVVSEVQTNKAVAGGIYGKYTRAAQRSHTPFTPSLRPTSAKENPQAMA
jgi:hypothetical protein